MEKGIVDNIILNYNPFILNKGIPLFKGNYFENKLKLEKIVKEKDDIVQVHYNIMKQKILEQRKEMLIDERTR